MRGWRCNAPRRGCRSSKGLSLLEEVVDTLFPNDPNERLHPPSLSLEEGEWREEWGVSEEELSRALRQLRRVKTPGPYGVPDRVLAMAKPVLGDAFLKNV